MDTQIPENGDPHGTKLTHIDPNGPNGTEMGPKWDRNGHTNGHTNEGKNGNSNIPK